MKKVEEGIKKMNGKKFFTGLVFCVLLAAIYVVADFTLKTESGDIVFNSSSGKVGIGTDSPGAELDIDDAGGLSGSPAIEFNGRVLVGYDGSRYAALIKGDSGKGIVFDTDGSNERMRITSGGDVGIGTASPNDKLDVNGNVDVNGYKITAVAELNGTGGDLLVTSGKNSGTVKIGVEDALRYYFESSMLRPAYDNTYDLGSSSYAWRDIYYEGSLTDTNPTLSRDNIIDLTGKTPLEIVSEIEHTVDGHIDLDSVPDFLKPCVRYSSDREKFKKTRTEYYTVTVVEYENVTETYEFVDEEGPKEAERVVQVPAGVKNVTKPVEIEYYDTTELEDVELCEEFGEGIKIDEYTNLVALAVQEQNQIIEDLTARIEKLEEAA